MPLKKVIEFPLFHVGQFTSSDGTPVPMTEALLRQIEKNTNFVLRSKVLQAPIGYDHPAASSDAHGTLVGTRYANGVLYAQGDNWSDRLVDDVKAMKRLAYSGELAPKFTYPDGTGKMIDVGPAVVGLAILGASRPAIKNLKPLSEFGFAEGTGAADEFITREELRNTGHVSEHSDGTKFFGEVENDARRFFSESHTEEQTTMTDAEKLEMQNAINAAVAAAVAPVKQANDALTEQLRTFSEDGVRKAEAHQFCEQLKADKKYMPEIPLGMLNDILADPTIPVPGKTKIKAFAAALPSFIAPGGVAGERKKKQAEGEGGEGSGEAEEPKELAAVRPKHFAEIDDAKSQQIVFAAKEAYFSEHPDELKGIENDPLAQIRKLESYVTKRDTVATN